MNDWKLPEDLQRLEDELKASPRPALPASLLTGIDQDVWSRRRGDRRRRWYWFMAAAAASALLWANLSLRAAIATDFQLAEQPQQSTMPQLEAQLHELLPDLDDREIHRQVVMIRAGSRVAPGLRGPLSAGRSHYSTDTVPLL